MASTILLVSWANAHNLFKLPVLPLVFHHHMEVLWVTVSIYRINYTISAFKLTFYHKRACHMLS
jgi:hypothetical protein